MQSLKVQHSYVIGEIVLVLSINIPGFYQLVAVACGHIEGFKKC